MSLANIAQCYLQILTVILHQNTFLRSALYTTSHASKMVHKDHANQATGNALQIKGGAALWALVLVLGILAALVSKYEK